MAGKVKAWKWDDPNAPSFPEDFEILQKAVLQKTDIKSNHNKYYAIELHQANQADNLVYRVFTHYGRTDDLEKNIDAGAKECRYMETLADAESVYLSIYKQKTSARKGYKEVALASSKIGSQKARGTSSGEVDASTLDKMVSADAPTTINGKIQHGVQSLVRYIYDEATNALTSTVAATITAEGIETPLGVLTLGQIEKGETILDELYDLFQDESVSGRDETVERLSSDFYTVIPHRIGRTRQAVQYAIINTLDELYQKQETLQLMKDMLRVNGETGNVLYNAKTEQEYAALNCQIKWLEPQSGSYREVADYLISSQVKSHDMKIKSIYKVSRPEEHDVYTREIGNDRMLFHGSRIQNWVGILSRGILLPKIVVSMGINRTDAGWLGHGIYFGDASDTSAFYTTAGRRNTRLIAVARVALGRVKNYTRINYGLSEPPNGYNSCHGVRNQKGIPSEFYDDEYVVYTTHQQRLEYLVELAL